METTAKSFYTVRFPDCDPFGHLNNSRYIDYFLNAREDHLKEVYNIDFQNYYKQGLAWVVAGHEIKYLKPALYNETVCIHSRLITLTDSLLQVELIMYNQAETQIKSVAWSTFVPINIKTGKREPHPRFFMELAADMRDLSVDVEQGFKKRVVLLQQKSVNV